MTDAGEKTDCSCLKSLVSTHLAQKPAKHKVVCCLNSPGMAPLNIMESNLPLPRDDKIHQTSLKKPEKTKPELDHMSASTGSPHKSLENMSAHLSLKTLGTMYHTQLNEARPQPHRRYQRRNSATASMLFTSANTASCETVSRNPSTTSVRPLNLSFTQQQMTPREALEKAREMMGNVPDIDFATRVKHGPAFKRSSAAEDCDGEEVQGRNKKPKTAETTEP